MGGPEGVAREQRQKKRVSTGGRRLQGGSPVAKESTRKRRLKARNPATGGKTYLGKELRREQGFGGVAP